MEPAIPSPACGAMPIRGSLLILLTVAVPAGLPGPLPRALAQEPIAPAEVESWVTDKGTAWAKPVLDVTD